MASDQLGVPPPRYKNRRGWLIAFGVVEILIACFSLLMAGAVLFSFLTLRTRGQAPVIPSAFVLLSVVFYGGIAAVFLAVGVGSIHCKNWARITMLAGSGLWLGIGVLSMPFTFLVLHSIMQQQGGMRPEARHFVYVVHVVITAATGFFMVVMPAVFLFFYSRKSVKATCLLQGAGAVPILTTTERAASKVPVPVIVLAIWQGLGVFAVFAFLVVRATVVFGLVLHGAAAFLLMSAFSVLSGCAAWLIYQRKFVGWAIALFNAVFGMASTVTTFAGRDMLQLYRQMGLSEQQLQVYNQFPQLLSAIWIITIPVTGAYLVFLLYTKKFFALAETQSRSSIARL